jgi:Ca2+-binding EF-hand superfamily protein
MAQLNITEKVLNLDTDNVFRIFDDDDNNLVDSLEFLSSFALLSGMTPEEKIRFIFALYDFDESSVLTLDEMVLAFRYIYMCLYIYIHIYINTYIYIYIYI